MNWSPKSSFYILVVSVLPFYSNCRQEPTYQQPSQEESVGSLMEIEDLQNRLHAESDLIVIDVRPLEEYSQGHIPQAFQVWRPQIQSKDYPYGGMMASRQQIADLLGSMGATPSHSIVLYDNNGCVDAARLWWILSYFGHKNTALLNGGLTAWEQAGYGITREEPLKEPQNYSFSRPSGDNSITATLEDVSKGLNDPNTLLLDTRTLEEYAGTSLKKGASRPGRIPGSIWADWVLSIDYGASNKFKTKEELRAIYEAKGITANHTVIAYCHSGVRSAHTTFVLTELLGYPNVFNYDGSWTEWSYHSELPIESDTVDVI